MARGGSGQGETGRLACVDAREVEESATWLSVGPQPELAAAEHKDAGGRRGRPWGGGLRVGVKGHRRLYSEVRAS
jgi:hypothetical protein